MTIREALVFGAKALKPHRCDGADPVREAEALLVMAAGTSRERFMLEPGTELRAVAVRRYRALLSRRRRHAPLAYLLGTAWFSGFEFAVDRRVLIPRPATEHVLAAALWAGIEQRTDLFIDAGTGSGCIAVTAALSLPAAKVIATDDAAGALSVARKNARRHGVTGRIRFAKGDLLKPAAAALSGAEARPLIVANLPYVPAAQRVSPCVRSEPRRAVFAPKDGTGPYRRLFRQLADLRAGRPFVLLCEILPSQYAPLRRELLRSFPAAAVTPIKNHQHRTVGLRAIAR
ncbi:MAG TPA: HemK/PrmC family methyltransferase [Candidatus Eisenbacteria bacterium]|nr:HemK/PrmC family methyltransferase [Candidatus Eisenbacteria bacterium]